MKILLLGDYSNYQACLGKALRKLGHDTTVASDRAGWMNTEANVSLKRPFAGPLGGAWLFASMMGNRRLRGYDVVSLRCPAFVTLKPERLRYVFRQLKRYNGAVFLEGLSTDKVMMDYLLSADCGLRYHEYAYEGNSKALESDRNWQKGAMADYCEEVYDNVRGVTTALYEYQLAFGKRFGEDNTAYTGIPIDLSEVRPVDHAVGEGKIRMFLGRHRERQDVKGTDRIGTVAEQIARDYPDKCRLEIVENVPYKEYVEKLRWADLVLDQLYSYTPATNALLAMASGQATLSGGEPEYYDFIGEKELKPVINAIPDEEKLYATLRECVLNPQIIKDAAAQGPEFVRRHNDSLLVARRHLDFWEKKI